MEKIEQIVEKYKGWFEYLNAHIYQSKPEEDLLLLRLWMTLHETGEIDELVLPDAHALYAFLGLFKYPSGVIYATNEKNEIDNITWFSPVDASAECRMANGAFYTSPSCRGKRRQLYFGYLAYSLAFEVYEAVIGATWQSDLLAVHQKLGYEINGCIPNLHNKEFVYVVRLTKDNFTNSRFMQTVNRITQRRK
jgi:hypothetical protein